VISRYEASNPFFGRQGELMYLSDEEPVFLPADEPPRTGEWADSHDDALALITQEEVDVGERLAELIDPDDDDDNGLQHIGGPER
jgi:hypothetical protein